MQLIEILFHFEALKCLTLTVLSSRSSKFSIFAKKNETARRMQDCKPEATIVFSGFNEQFFV
jgi:hypothetical protein